MSALVKASIAGELALIERVVEAPSGDLGWGSDLSCAADIDPNAAEVSPASTLGLAQAIVRRLDCPRGALPDDGSYGIDLRGWLHRGVTLTARAELEAEVRKQVLLDDRLGGAFVTVTPPANALRDRSLSVTIQAVPVLPGVEPFRLVLAVTDAGVLIEEMATS